MPTPMISSNNFVFLRSRQISAPRLFFARLYPNQAHVVRSVKSPEHNWRTSQYRMVSTALRVDKVAGHMTELLQLHSSGKPTLQIIFIPGNPGIVPFYKDYLESLYKLFDGEASITAISHIAHTAKDWEAGQQFTLEQQIDHKAVFVRDVLDKADAPIVLVGHSIGAYITLELLKRFPEKIDYVVGLFPFLTTNTNSLKQSFLKTTSRYSFFRGTLSAIAGIVGQSPTWASKNLVKAIFGRAWGAMAVDVACEYLLRPSMVRNFSFMGMTEFEKLQSELDWAFVRENENRISLLFGSDDHWGPLSLMEEMRKEASGLDTTVKSDILHDFCCTVWASQSIAEYTSRRIRKKAESLN